MNSASDYVNVARRAGIVGAGGGGFPMYVKLQASVDTVIANGAECEPLLHKDKQLMLRHADQVLRGLLLAGETVGARHHVIALKAKYQEVVDAVRAAARDTAVAIHTLDNFYPSGDEYVLVYEVNGRLIPTGGLPKDVGCLVQNSETLANLTTAVDSDRPVTDSWVTVTGAVREPATFCVALGTPFQALLDAAGGVTVPDPVILDGGAMMGQLVTDLAAPVTKTTAGLVVLDRSHTLIARRELPRRKLERIGLSACDQCYYCTEFCPRFLLGHPIEPHKVMRSLGFVGTDREYWSEWAAACCECNLCSLYACPEDLDPKNMCTWSKREVLAQGYTFPEPRKVEAHPLAQSRKVPLPKLIQRLGLREYDRPALFRDAAVEAEVLTVRLDQHRGKPAAPAVSQGQRVQAGDVIGEVSADDLGCPVHAPRSGTVREITDTAVLIERS
jgi:Na+-translocating ferredoxin:NAD+ oxidoreductase RnfC subunit